MPLSDMLLPEFDVEMEKLRTTLERVPQDKPEYKPHDKSMALKKLADHVGELPGFLSLMLATDAFDLANPSVKFPPAPESHDERLERFDAAVATARTALAGATDRAMHESWKLSAGDRVIFSGSRYQALRMMFFNHMIHHRAQLGVYLRLNDVAVPSIYGPSADEK